MLICALQIRYRRLYYLDILLYLPTKLQAASTLECHCSHPPSYSPLLFEALISLLNARHANSLLFSHLLQRQVHHLNLQAHAHTITLLTTLTSTHLSLPRSHSLTSFASTAHSSPRCSHCTNPIGLALSLSHAILMTTLTFTHHTDRIVRFARYQSCQTNTHLTYSISHHCLHATAQLLREPFPLSIAPHRIPRNPKPLANWMY